MERHDASSDTSRDAAAESSRDASVDVRRGVDAEAGQDATPANIMFANQNANSGNGSSVSVSLPDVNANDALVVWVNFDPSSGAALTATPVVDNMDTNYGSHPAIGPYSGAGLVNYVYVAFDVQEGSRTVTASLSKDPGDGGLEVYVMEYGGMRKLDDYATSEGMGNAGDTITSGSVTTSVPNELILGLALAVTVDVGAGFMLVSNYNGNVVEDMTAGAAGKSYHATATLGQSSAWMMIAAAFE